MFASRTCDGQWVRSRVRKVDIGRRRCLSDDDVGGDAWSEGWVRNEVARRVRVSSCGIGWRQSCQIVAAMRAGAQSSGASPVKASS